VLQCIINITLKQVQPYITAAGETIARNETFHIDFCHSLEVYSSWKDLSDTATIELPKNVYVLDNNNKQVVWGESTTPDKVRGYVNAGGFNNPMVSKAPLFMRGDEISIRAGYSYISKINDDRSLQYSTTTKTIFHGFISSIESKSNVKLHCEDYMWLLKQTTMPEKTYYSPNSDISNVLEDIVAQSKQVNSNYPITANTGGFALSVDGFNTGNETAAEVLNKLKKILPSMAFYFRESELRGGGIVYYPNDQGISTGTDGKTAYKTFDFQKNIISDALHYSLKADVKVGAICYSVSSQQGATMNKMGGMQSITNRFQASIGDNMPLSATADNYEYYTFYFKDVPDQQQLSTQGQTYLNRYQYDGFRGKFKTFGLPFVQHGNIIYITDSLLPERNGHYIVKGVHYSFGVDSGLRQDIELHFRTDDLTQDQLGQGM
jgi:hypothetical protein